jgi:hypothetical protein
MQRKLMLAQSESSSDVRRGRGIDSSSSTVASVTLEQPRTSRRVTHSCPRLKNAATSAWLIASAAVDVRPLLLPLLPQPRGAGRGATAPASSTVHNGDKWLWNDAEFHALHTRAATTISRGVRNANTSALSCDASADDRIDTARNSNQTARPQWTQGQPTRRCSTPEQ